MTHADTRTTVTDMTADRELRSKGVRVRVRSYETLCFSLRARYQGILTPTGKEKKLPWFFVGWCSRCCEVKFSGSRYPAASRFRCPESLYEHGAGSAGKPHTVICGAPLRPLQPVGISRFSMHEAFSEWKIKYG